MAFVNTDACECISSGLNLFSIPPTQRSIESGKYIDYHPINPIDSHPINPIAEGVQGTPIEFEIPSAGDEYTDLCNSLIYVRLKVVQADGTDIVNDTVVAPTNLFLQSFLSS